MALGQRIHLRLFLEGIEVPVISASIQSQPNSPAACSIQIPANDFAFDLKPRTLVHLFFYDLYKGAPSSERAWVQGAGIDVTNTPRDPDLDGLVPPDRFEATTTELKEDLDNENYKLLFGGEVVGVSMQKTPMSRSIVLQCMDWSMYWDYAFQYQVSGMSFGGGGGMQAAFTGAATTLFNDFLSGSGDIIVGLMNTPPRSYPNLRGTLLGAIVHIIEAIGGVTYGTRAIKGVNDFFSIAELRLKLTQMVGANPYAQQDEVRLMSANGFGGLFGRALSGLGKQVSIRSVLNALQRYVFHEIVPITSPHYIPALVDPNRPQYNVVSIEEVPEWRPILTAAANIRHRLIALKDKNDESFAGTVSIEQASRGLRQELATLRAACARAERQARQIAVRRRTSFVDNTSISALFTSCSDRIRNVREITGQPGPPSNAFGIDYRRVAQNLSEAIFNMDEVMTLKIRNRVRSSTYQPDPPPRLLTQIYRPDVWMVAPPRCNVFFPEHYSAFDYGRSFMDEITRLMLRTHEAWYGSDILFDGFYMAPSKLLGSRTGKKIARGRAGLEPADLSDAPAWFIRDMMDHELYTGIIPKFEKMSDLNLHAIRGGNILIDGVRVGYAQLAANHLFFQYRFKSRQLSLQGKFNPYAVLGFPALVIDKYKPAKEPTDAERAIASTLAAATLEGEGTWVNVPESQYQSRVEQDAARIAEVTRDILGEDPGRHYLGTPAIISHAVGVGSGSTQIQMMYSRVSDEKTEFLGDDRYTPTQFRRTRNVRRVSTVACLEEPRVGSTGPLGGEIIAVEDVTQQFQTSQRARPVRGRRATSATGQQRYQGRSKLPIYIPGNRTGRVRGSRVFVGVEIPASTLPEIAATVGSIGGTQSGFVTSSGTGNDLSPAVLTETTVTFRAFKITENVGLYRRTAVDLPAEDLTFPPWYGEHYRSQNIGGLYSYFFGTGSIVDPTVITGPQGATRIEDNTREPEIRAPETPSSTTEQETAEYTGTPGTPAGDREVLASIEARGTIEDAVEQLVTAYSEIRRNKFDVDDFLKSYTWRPIASMLDIFGTSNLEIDETGAVVQGVEGFHSRAFGDFDDLRQLVRNVEGDRPATILGISTRDSGNTASPSAQRSASRDAARASRLDTRREKRLAVLRYLQATLSSAGILG